MLKVTLAGLYGDPDNLVQAGLAEALAAADGIAVTTLPGPLPAADELPGGEFSVPSTEAAGADVLRTEDGHIMVWGEVRAEDRTMRLRFYVQPDPSDADSPLLFTDWLELPTDMPEDVAKAFCAATAAAAANGLQEGEYSAVELATALLPDLENLVDDPPEILPRNGLHTLMYYAFRMRKLIFLISDDDSDLAAAMGASSRLLEATREDNPEGFARAAKQYGDLLQVFEAPDEDPQYLDTAVMMYDLALQFYERDEQPDKWAYATFGMGYALGKIGSNRWVPDASLDAVDAYKAAATVLTPETDMATWANIVEGLSTVYGDLERMLHDPDWLDQAVAMLDDALEKIARDRNPVEWETFTFELGAKLTALGEATKTLAPHQRAVRVLKAALTSIDPVERPNRWGSAKNCLGISFQYVGSELKDAPTLKSAVAAYEDALTVRTRTDAPKFWADSMNNAGNSYRDLGELTGDGHALEQAIAALENALSVRTREETPFEWASSMNNLALAHAQAGKHLNDPERLRQAVSIFQEVLAMAESDHPNLANAVRNNLELIQQDLAAMTRH